MSRADRARALAARATSLIENLFVPYAEMADDPANDPAIYTTSALDERSGLRDDDNNGVDDALEGKPMKGSCMSCMQKAYNMACGGDAKGAASELKGAMSAYKKEHGGKMMCGKKH